jgi:biopolymer transport protein ExbD
MIKKNQSVINELPLGEINIIPIVDVSFCLVIFCLVAMNIMLTAGINVSGAKIGVRSGTAAGGENVSVILTQDNRILVNNHEVAPVDLAGRFLALLPATKDKMVTITAHESNRCEQVVDVLDLAKKCGAQRLVLMNNPPHGASAAAPRLTVAKVHSHHSRKRKRHA